MNKFGLYVVDSSEEIELEGFNATGKKWKREGLFYNGKPIYKTNSASNNLGVYISSNNLKLNGESIAVKKDLNAEILIKENTVLFGDSCLYSDKCINITLTNYNKLRQGELVYGYAKYNPKAVYNIVDNINTANEIYCLLPENLDDKVYNSFTSSIPHNKTTDSNYLDPTHTPSLAIRAFNAIINSNEGVTLEYFVDTSSYDSIYSKSLGNPANTFTVIIEDSYNNVIYKHTTYAGEFICTTSPFKNLDGTPFVGITFFTIKCIDNKGRESISRSFKVLIKDANKENKVYNMKESDLQTFHITQNSSSLDCVAGYNNKVGFSKLFKWCKDNGYDEIKIYNPFAAIGKTNKYFIDNHHKLNLYTNEYALSEAELSHYKGYYLVKYVNGKIEGINKEVHDYKKSDFELFKIISGTSLVMDNKLIQIPSNLTPFEWIAKDGANIYRNSEGKIIVLWAHDLKENEVASEWSNIGTKRVLRIKSLNSLLITCLNKNSKNEYTNNISSIFPEGDGYYYLACLPGTNTKLNPESKVNDYVKDGTNAYPIISMPMVIPDNFTIDLNNSIWETTDSTDIYTKNKMFHFGGVTNSHLKNGKIIGPYTPEKLKEAFLKCCRHTTSAWEGYSLIALDGSEFCTLENIEVSQSGGYETVLGTILTSLPVSDLHYGFKSITGNSSDKIYHSEDVMRISTPGYIKDGQLVSLNFVIKNNGQSLLPSSKPELQNNVDYNHWDGATDVCLATSDDFINLDLHFTFKLHGVQKNWETDGHLNAYYITSDCYDPARSWHAGKRPEFFVSFYDSDNKFIKTIKTTQHRPFYAPYRAVKIKLTGYGLCNVLGDEVLLVLDPSTLVERSLKDLKIKIDLCTYGSKFINYTVHNTRTIAICGVGINNLFINCSFYEISSAPSRLGVTKMFMDIEENCNLNNVLTFENCTALANMNTKNEYNHGLIAIGIVAQGAEIKLDNCRGLGLSGALTDCLLKDSTLGVLTINSYRHLSNRCYNILKRIKVIYRTQFNFDENVTSTVGASGVGYKVRNTTDEIPTNTINLEDSAVNHYNSNYGNMSVKGRSYFIKDKPVNNYSENYVEL